MKIHLKVVDGNLIAIDAKGQKYLYKLNQEDVYYVNIKRERNYEFHKKLFALLNLAYENIETKLSFDTWRKIIVMEAGYFTAHNTGKGVWFEPSSLEFDKMSQDTFDEMYNKVLQLLAGKIGLTNEELEIEVLTNY